MEKLKDGILKISVRNLVEFICRYGDIDNRRAVGGSVELMNAGSKIHRKIQSRMGLNYQAEVSLKIICAFEKFDIVVEGRTDGILTEKIKPDENGIVPVNNENVVPTESNDIAAAEQTEIEAAERTDIAAAENGKTRVTIDEIKSVKRDVALIKEPDPVHLAQAKVYAYIYASQNELDNIFVQMTYCNIDTEETRRFVSGYTIEALRIWFDDIIRKYSVWVEYMYDENIKKMASIKGLQFPFEYRKGQRDLTVSAYKTISEGKKLFIQAPTGVGKTISTVFPAVKAIGEGYGEKIFYLTAKTVTAIVAEGAFETLRDKGLHFKTVTITAKDKICVMDETECNPDYCPRAKGHYDRINDAIYDMITHETEITRECVLSYAEKHNVCPFEMTLDTSNWMDGVICDYNYVFDPNVYLKRYFADGGDDDYIFLVDEAHNLVERAREMYSAVLYKEQFLAIKKIFKKYSESIARMIEKCNRDMLSYKRECDGYMVRREVGSLIGHLQRLKSALDKFLDEHREFDGRKEILEFYFDITNFLNISDLVDENYEIYTELEGRGDFKVKLLCVNPSANLSERLAKGYSTLFFSATMLPINYYKELLGGDVKIPAIYINSPFDQDNRIIVNAVDVSSKYTRRTESEFAKIGGYIKDITAAHRGNYMVFFPSYKMMQDVYACMEREGLSDGMNIVVQERNMMEADREDFLRRFNEPDADGLTAFCVLGGIFSEGIDLKHESLIGSIIVGTGLPQVCAEKEILKDHYDRQGKSGFDYAYRFPGMNKVQQAAGRVIRTSADRGVIALLDERFSQRQYRQLFPREWSDCVTVNMRTVRDAVENFWK